jgi:Cof subfamily protein (haloacid dehalogenase superfamily)
VKASSRRIDSVDELEKQGIIIHKIFLFTGDLEMLDKIKRRLMQNPELAVASSFYNNLEITVKGAEKGPAIQEYIESLGYTKDEVMVFGDSLNDYSMLSMDFGATVAMENADDEVKQVSKYVTKSNEDLGVAYTIHELLKKQGITNSNC